MCLWYRYQCRSCWCKLVVTSSLHPTPSRGHTIDWSCVQGRPMRHNGMASKWGRLSPHVLSLCQSLRLLISLQALSDASGVTWKEQEAEKYLDWANAVFVRKIDQRLLESPCDRCCYLAPERITTTASKGVVPWRANGWTRAGDAPVLLRWTVQRDSNPSACPALALPWAANRSPPWWCVRSW